MATSTIKVPNEIQTWTPKLYDLDTYVRDMPTGWYMRQGKLVVAWISTNTADLSGINTMMQIKNLPMSAVIGGSVYIANLSGQGAETTIQSSAGALYLRPNVKSSQMSTPSSPGWITICMIGYMS